MQIDLLYASLLSVTHLESVLLASVACLFSWESSALGQRPIALSEGGLASDQ